MLCNSLTFGMRQSQWSAKQGLVLSAARKTATVNAIPDIVITVVVRRTKRLRRLEHFSDIARIDASESGAILVTMVSLVSEVPELSISASSGECVPLPTVAINVIGPVEIVGAGGAIDRS